MAFQTTLLVLFCFLNMVFVYATSTVNLHNLTIEDYVDYVNPPAVHKIENDGLTILCVKFEDQISIRNEEQYWKSKVSLNQGFKKNTFNSSYRGLQKCPEGTVAVPEITHEQVRHAGSVSNFLSSMKGTRWGPNHTDTAPNRPKAHEYAIVKSVWPAPTIVSASAFFSVWKPFVSPQNGIFSLSQLWFSTHPQNNQLRETIEVGWHVYPAIYNQDTRPHFFVFWTNDGYGQHSCYNMDCPGFVSTSWFSVPGSPIRGYSELYGEQVEQYYRLQRQVVPNVGPSWVLYINNERIGYFPASLFRSLSTAAQRVDFGGEVAFYKDNLRVSTTEMGSGLYSYYGFTKSAYIRKQETIDANNNLRLRAPIHEVIESSDRCYNAALIMNFADPDWGKNLFYGGPGAQNPDCR